MAGKKIYDIQQRGMEVLPLPFEKKLISA